MRNGKVDEKGLYGMSSGESDVWQCQLCGHDDTVGLHALRHFGDVYVTASLGQGCWFEGLV